MTQSVNHSCLSFYLLVQVQMLKEQQPMDFRDVLYQHESNEGQVLKIFNYVIV